MRSSHALLFGPYRLDPVNGDLWRGEDALELPPKPLAVLCYLIEHRGQLVSKEELLDALWEGRCVGEAVLKSSIRAIREILHDDPKAPQYIETRPRRGYRFIAELTSASPIPFPEAAPPPASLLIGREEMLRQLRGILEQALRGERQVVFVTGEPGIGKTALIETFLQALGPGVKSLCGQCIEQYGQGEPYAPVLEALNSLAREAGEPLLRLMRQYAPTWLMQLPWFLTDADRALLQREVLGATKERMLRELGEFLERWTAQCPLILVLEDLHWSDYATLDLISYLPKRADAARLMLIGTYRPVEVIVSGHPLKAVKQELLSKRQCKELPLKYLSKEAVAEYLAVRFPANRFPAALGGLIHERTEGNPLFMVNAVDYLVTEGLIGKAEEVWQLGTEIEKIEVGVPDSIKQMIEKQVGYLSKEEQRMLEAASVLGVEFSTLTVAAGLGENAAIVEAQCEELARRHQFIRDCGFHPLPNGEVAARYGFIHALYQNVLYEQMSAAKRVHLHRRAGERGEELYGERAGEIAAELADHFERGCEYLRSVRYLDQAAENAARRYANREAVAYLNRALALVERLPPAEQEGIRVSLLQRRAHVQYVMDDLDGATEDLKRVLRYGRERNDQALAVKTLIEISRIARWVDSRHCLEAAAEAEAISRDLDDEFIKVCARVNCARANLFFAEWRQDNVATCRSGFRVVRAARDPSLILSSSAWVECMSSNYELARLVAEEAARIAQGLGDSLHFMQFRWLELWTLIYLGRLGEVRRGLTHALSVAEKNGNHSWIMNCRLILARVHEEALDFEGARIHCDYALKICRERRSHLFTVHGFILLGQAYLGLQDSTRAYEHLSEAARLCEDAMRIADWHMYLPLHQGLAEYWLVQNDLTQAREMASKLCAHAALPPERTYLALGHQLLAEIALAENQCAQAEMEVARAMSAINGAPTSSTVWHAYGIAPPVCSSPCAGWSVPLAAWRVYATAARLCERQGRQGEADAYRQQSRAVIQQLADSLDGSDPLRTSLLAGHERVIRSTAMASISEHANGSLA